MSVPFERMGWTNENPPALNDTNLDLFEDHIQNALDTIGDDTGWTNLILENVTAHDKGGSSQPQYKKKGNQVFVRGAVEGAWDGNNNLVIATLPDGFRPANQLYRILPTQGSIYTRLRITSQGVMDIEQVLNLASGENYTSNRWFDLELNFEL